MDGSYNLPLASAPCGRPTKPCPPCPAASPISSSLNFLMYSDKVLIASLDGRQDSSAFNFYLNPSLDKFRWDVLSMQLPVIFSNSTSGSWSLCLDGFHFTSFTCWKQYFITLTIGRPWIKEHFADCMTRLDWVVAALLAVVAYYAMQCIFILW